MAAVRERAVELARRRGGGGAVYLGPGEQLWLDAWIPRDDPLWLLDVSAAAEWVGAWWTGALAGLGQQGFDVHHGRSLPGDLGDLVCFAGRGPGEVFHRARKVVGLSQWRAREGALFSSCAYLYWDPAPLLALVEVDEERVWVWPVAWRLWESAWPSSTRRRAISVRQHRIARFVPCLRPDCASGRERSTRLGVPAGSSLLLLLFLLLLVFLPSLLPCFLPCGHLRLALGRGARPVCPRLRARAGTEAGGGPKSCVSPAGRAHWDPGEPGGLQLCCIGSMWL